MQCSTALSTFVPTCVHFYFVLIFFPAANILHIRNKYLLSSLTITILLGVEKMETIGKLEICYRKDRKKWILKISNLLSRPEHIYNPSFGLTVTVVY